MEWITILISFPAGLLLGFFFFRGLWWTVERCATVKNPLLMFLASFLVRMAVVMAGFYLLLMQGPVQLFLALGGFLASRFWQVRAIGPRKGGFPGGGKA